MGRLKLSLTATYRIIGTTRTRLKLIAAKDVVSILNNARRGGTVVSEMNERLSPK